MSPKVILSHQHFGKAYLFVKWLKNKINQINFSAEISIQHKLTAKNTVYATDVFDFVVYASVLCHFKGWVRLFYTVLYISCFRFFGGSFKVVLHKECRVIIALGNNNDVYSIFFSFGRNVICRRIQACDRMAKDHR